MRIIRWSSFAAAVVVTVSLDAAQPPQSAASLRRSSPQLDQYKRNVGLEVDALQENIQKWNDSVFSFGELGFQEFETTKYLTGDPEAERLHDPGGRRRHPDGVDRAMGIGQAGDRARVGRRLHPAGVAEAGRRLARTDHRGRAGPRRRTQLRDAAADCGGPRREEGDGAAASAGHADAVAGHRGRTGRHQGLLRARGALQGRRHLDLRARRRQPRRHLGRRDAERAGVRRVHVQGRERARRRRAVARQVGARRGRS